MWNWLRLIFARVELPPEIVNAVSYNRSGEDPTSSNDQPIRELTEPGVSEFEDDHLDSESTREDLHPYAETLDLDVKSWCYGLHHLNETPDPRVVYRVIGELASTLRESIRQGYVFSVTEIAENLSVAARRVVAKKEIIFYVLAQVPNPATLNKAERNTLGAIIRLVDDQYRGAVERCCERWRLSPAGATDSNPVHNGPLALPAILPPVLSPKLEIGSVGRLLPFSNPK